MENNEKATAGTPDCHGDPSGRHTPYAALFGKRRAEVSFIDALFTSTSAVCVTGLIVIDTADHFTAFGQGIVAALIQIGGLGVTSIGVGLIIMTGKRVSMKSRVMVKEALNVNSYRGMVRLVKAVLLMTVCFETVGAILSFLVFSQHYPIIACCRNQHLPFHRCF